MTPETPKILLIHMVPIVREEAPASAAEIDARLREVVLTRH